MTGHGLGLSSNALMATSECMMCRLHVQQALRHSNAIAVISNWRTFAVAQPCMDDMLQASGVYKVVDAFGFGALSCE